MKSSLCSSSLIIIQVIFWLETLYDYYSQSCLLPKELIENVRISYFIRRTFLNLFFLTFSLLSASFWRKKSHFVFKIYLIWHICFCMYCHKKSCANFDTLSRWNRKKNIRALWFFKYTALVKFCYEILTLRDQC